MDKPQRYGVSYARFSHRRQESGSSIERQEQLLAAYLEANPDVTLHEQFSDRGVSGFRGKHARQGALSRLLDGMRTGRLPSPFILIIEAIDRLGREPIMDAFKRFSELLEAGVTIAVCDMRLEVDREALNQESWKLHSVINAMERAHGESKRKSDMITLSWNMRIKAATTGGSAIKGYVGPPWVSMDPTTNRYVVAPKDDPTVQTVEKIFAWACEGTTAHAIAKRLNERGVSVFRAHIPKDRVRQGWYQGYITTILQNRQVLGEHRYRSGEIIEGYFPQIISPERFYRAQEAMTRREGKPGRKGKTLSNLFTGLARCAHCGGHMEMTRNRPTSPDGPPMIKYLMCSNKKRRHGCEATGMINYSHVETTILDKLVAVPWGEIIRAENPADPLPALDDALTTILLEIAELQTTRDRAKTLLLKGGEYEAEFEPVFEQSVVALKDADERYARLQVERAKAAASWGDRPGLAKTATDYRNTMNIVSEAEQFAIRERLSETLRSMITSMVCDRVEKTVIATYGDRWELMIKMPIRRKPIALKRWKHTIPSDVKIDPTFAQDFDALHDQSVDGLTWELIQ